MRTKKEGIVVVVALFAVFFLSSIAFAVDCPIPDTGQTKCYDNTVEITCPSPGEPFYGQDAQYVTNPQSYTKLDGNGNDLPQEATEWVMVRDNVTGLIWEVKTNDGSIHDKDNFYNWYDAQDVFMTSLNAESFGGFSDWRLPTVKELSFIINNGAYNPSINTDYFPNTVSDFYWSFTTTVDYGGAAWLVRFSDGMCAKSSKGFNWKLRAVRGGQSSQNLIDNGNGTITDANTSLMWQQNGLTNMNWADALSYSENLTLGGYNDWRLPNTNELQSLIDYEQYNPSINTAYFPDNSNSYYWSSTNDSDNTNNAWLVYFDYGAVVSNAKLDSYYVRAVRAGGLDSDGDLMWAKTYGGSESDQARSIYQTIDGGYIVCGNTLSFGAGLLDFWILKLDINGEISWQKTYGGSESDIAYSIQQTSDGGYIVAGVTESFGAGYRDCWVLKLNSNGNVAWQKTYGGGTTDEASSIQQTSDGGYIVAGEAKSFGAGEVDILVLKLDGNGNVSWGKTYGGSSDDWAKSIQQTSDGGYIVAGYTASFGAGGGDIWVLKLDSIGDVIWQKTYGGSDGDVARSTIQQTSDGGYIVAGKTVSFGAGGGDIWVLKLNSDGNVSWQKTYGGSDQDAYSSIQQTSDGGYIVAGYTDSFGAGLLDFWILKLDDSGGVSWQKTYGGVGEEYCHSIQQTIDGGYIVAGYTDSFGVGRDDSLLLKLDSNGEITNCDIINTSSATVHDTSATIQNSNATIIETSATITNTSYTPENTTADITVLCYCSETVDYDCDGILNEEDNCPDNYNPGQEDVDEDELGDACDNCLNDYNPGQEDVDEDGVGNVCDNCSDDANSNQEDTDEDSLGDACDICPNDPENDIDNDGICGDIDNCPNMPNGPNKGTCIWGENMGALCTLAGINPMQCGAEGFCSMNQEDADTDGFGDACDECEVDEDCYDGVFCNGLETCVDRVCQSGTNPCPETECNICQEDIDSCFDPSGTPCNDDGNVCTDDQCDGDGTCEHTNNNNPCNDGMWCTVDDICGGGSCSGSARDCSSAGDQCNDGICDDTLDQCIAQPKADGISCNDGFYCNGIDTCSSGTCSDHAGDPCPAGTICSETYELCVIPPVPPTGLEITYYGDTFVGLAWDENTGADLEGYKVYYGTSPGNYGSPIDVGDVLEYELSDLNEGVTYHVAVTAEDIYDNESGYSNEVSVITNTASGPELCGNITEDTRLIKANSPYIVTCTVQVYENATLLVEPGVVIKFNPDTGMTIGGELIAIGTESDMIQFTSNQENPEAGDWRNIKFVDSAVDAVVDDETYYEYISGSGFKYCIIEYAGESGIHCDDASPYIGYSIIRNNSTDNGGGGIFGSNNSRLIITNNEIKNNSASWRGGGINANDAVIINNVIHNNTVYDFGGGVYVRDAVIRNNVIHNNTANYGGGIRGDSLFIKNNLIYCNEAARGGAIYGDGILENNTIVYNTANDRGAGIDFRGSIFYNLISNNYSRCYISGNSVDSIYTGGENTKITANNLIYNMDDTEEIFINIEGNEDIDATNNYWGTTDSSEIDAKIYDHWDNIELGEVLYNPFEIEEIPDAGSTLPIPPDLEPCLPYPGNPYPPDSSINQTTYLLLSWNSICFYNYDANFRVYFGTSTPPPLVEDGYAFCYDRYCDYWLDELDYSTTYYWQVVEVGSISEAEGPVWSFTTKSEFPKATIFPIYGSTVQPTAEIVITVMDETAVDLDNTEYSVYKEWSDDITDSLECEKEGDGSQEGTITCSKSSGLDLGVYFVEVTPKDLAGNVGTTVSSFFAVSDTTPTSSSTTTSRPPQPPPNTTTSIETTSSSSISSTTTEPSTTTSTEDCSITLEPQIEEVMSGQSLTFTVNATGDCNNSDYEWSVDSEIRSSCNQSGEYTAGINFNMLNPATDVVSVVDHGNGDISAEANVTVSFGCPSMQIYGENSEEVQVLRNFRDDILTQTPEGREIIKLYYEWGPVIVKAMEEDEEFKEEIKEMIDGVLMLIAEETE